MNLKNIIALLCVVCLVSTVDISTEDQTPETSEKTKDITEGISQVEIDAVLDDRVSDEWKKKWQVIFTKYAHKKHHMLSAVELQSLLFNESIGLIPIYLAEQLISVLNRTRNNNSAKANVIGFEHFSTMSPILEILSKRKIKNYPEYGNRKISVKKCNELLWRMFQKTLFKKKEEASEITKLMGLNENDEITMTKVDEIEDMLRAADMLDDLLITFLLYDKNNDGVICNEDWLEKIKDYTSNATIHHAARSIKKYDINNDGVIDFPEFLRMMKTPYSVKNMFKGMFIGKPITRKQLNDLVQKSTGTLLDEDALNSIDPENKNEISYTDLESYYRPL